MSVRIEKRIHTRSSSFRLLDGASVRDMARVATVQAKAVLETALTLGLGETGTGGTRASGLERVNFHRDWCGRGRSECRGVHIGRCVEGIAGNGVGGEGRGCTNILAVRRIERMEALVDVRSEALETVERRLGGMRDKTLADDVQKSLLELDNLRLFGHVEVCADLAEAGRVRDDRAGLLEIAQLRMREGDGIGGTEMSAERSLERLEVEQ